jgi:hypothetical protein
LFPFKELYLEKLSFVIKLKKVKSLVLSLDQKLKFIFMLPNVNISRL